MSKDVASQAKERARNCKDMAIADPEYTNGAYSSDMKPDALIAAVTGK